MFSSRALQVSASMLRAQAPKASAARSGSKLFTQTRGIRLQASPVRRSPMPKEEHSAHTISQRLRTLKKIPPELIPLGVVLFIAVGFAVFSLTRKLYTDGTLRLYRSRGHNQASSPEDTKAH
ncbi:hypothetical protein AAFC00_002117 [Neodothiora populina]|uniref:Uncharacterized protein n=1 Tax=Neodothiora populina TaxID=2781224 RepID=A0ABR3PGL8_9PEZI